MPRGETICLWLCKAFGHEEMSAQLDFGLLQFSANFLGSLALISALAVLVEGRFASQSEGLGHCATVTPAQVFVLQSGDFHPSSEAAPHPCTTFSCRNFSVLSLLISTMDGFETPNYFARIPKHVWICFPSHRGLAHPFPVPQHLGTRKNIHKTPTKTPHQFGNQQHLKNWSDTRRCKHRDNYLSSCVFLHPLSPLGCFYILAPAPISALGFHCAPGARATHPFPSRSCHPFGSAHGWFAKPETSLGSISQQEAPPAPRWSKSLWILLPSLYCLTPWPCSWWLVQSLCFHQKTLLS